MKLTLLFILAFFTGFCVVAQTPTDVFFSEYIEGSGNNKALEIYNPTSQTIDLSNYYVLRFSNGSSTFAEGGATRLSGTLAPYKTFVLVNGQITSTPTSPSCSPVLQAMANQLDGAYPAPTYMNGNDAIALVKTPGGAAPSADMSNVTSVDLIGQIGLGAVIASETGWSYVQDTTVTYNSSTGEELTGKVINYIVQAKSTSGGFGPFWFSWTSNHTLIRKPSVVKGVVANPSPFKVALEWDTAAAVLDTAGHFQYEDIWTNLGTHVCKADPTFGVNETPASSGLSIYPNPVVNERFTISSKLPVKELEIISVIGQSIYRQEYKKGMTLIEIGPLDIDKGIYLVKITLSNNSVTAKKILVK